MELTELLKEMGNRFKPYSEKYRSFEKIPENGLEHGEILDMLRGLESGEEPPWKKGYVSGAVYNGSERHITFTNEAYSIASQTNPLHPDVFPSALKIEQEIVSMTGRMLGGDAEVRGSVTSGGTESILLAMKTYRDWARATKGIKNPEIVLPVSAHAAFDKACSYFGITPRLVPLDKNFQADVGKVRESVNENTIAIVGSAPCFPYGTIDPIGEMSGIARDLGIGFHVDACLGGFVLPWARKLGYKVPDFDFGLPGVTSMSVDTHKYGYAPKGTSVILYRNPELIHHQYYVTTAWPGGIYFSPTMAGSRSGGVVAAAWAVLLATGEKGYMENTRRIIETAARIKEGIAKIPELRLMGDSLWVVAFASEKTNIYQVMETMASRGWALNGLHKPAGVHLAVTLRHTNDEVVNRFLSDLRESVRECMANPGQESGMAPVYGMAGSLPEEAVSEFLKSIVEWMYTK